MLIRPKTELRKKNMIHFATVCYSIAGMLMYLYFCIASNLDINFLTGSTTATLKSPIENL